MRLRRYIGHARRAIEEWELLELLDRCASPAYRVIYCLAADAGLRRAEILGLTAEDVTETRIRVAAGKCNVTRWTINTERIRAGIAAADWWNCWRPCYGWIGGAMKVDLARAGLPADLSLHCLRHRFATRLLRGGVNLMDISALLGHNELASTAVYLHDSPQRYDQARLAIEGLVCPQGSLFPGEAYR